MLVNISLIYTLHCRPLPDFSQKKIIFVSNVQKVKGETRLFGAGLRAVKDITTWPFFSAYNGHKLFLIFIEEKKGKIFFKDKAQFLNAYRRKFLKISYSMKGSSLTRDLSLVNISFIFYLLTMIMLCIGLEVFWKVFFLYHVFWGRGNLMERRVSID